MSMSNEDRAIEPILAAKRTIEQAIEGHLQKIAALRKRADALQTAIHVLRSSDQELLDLMPSLPSPPLRFTHKPQPLDRVIKFDEAAVELELTAYLTATGPHKFQECVDYLRGRGMRFSEYGLRRIIKTGPQFEVNGVRGSTRYSVKTLIENKP